MSCNVVGTYYGGTGGLNPGGNSYSSQLAGSGGANTGNGSAGEGGSGIGIIINYHRIKYFFSNSKY